ncbi:aldehyde dehydrogenase family protein, partial [Escherichia coli]
MAAMRVGPGSDNRNDMGPLVTQQHYQKVKGYIDQGVAEGAELLVDGRELRVTDADGRPSQGYFLGPTLFDRVTPGMRIYQEEIFGPVLGVVRAASLQEAMALIDAHEYG